MNNQTKTQSKKKQKHKQTNNQNTQPTTRTTRQKHKTNSNKNNSMNKNKQPKDITTILTNKPKTHTNKKIRNSVFTGYCNWIGVWSVYPIINFTH